MPSSIRPIHIIQGGQYGSEAKGTIAAYYAERFNYDYAVRTGATNAGHVCVYNGQRYTMQQLPVAWVCPSTALVIGAGSLVDLDILDREITMITAATGQDPRPRIYIDGRAWIHRPAHAEKSRVSGRHHAMGATGKGCSEAYIERIAIRGDIVQNRLADNFRIGSNRSDGRLRGINIGDTERILNNDIDKGAMVMLEGTQGQLLDIALGPHPYTTHKQTGPAQWMLEAGLSPALPVRVTLVVRTYPIRVAGNSGPLMNEMSWIELGRHINSRREQAQLGPIVSDSALEAFELALLTAADEFDMPSGHNMALKQHLWTDHQRSTYREAISELNKVALGMVDSVTLTELKKLFEMTTVTKKLRRIARINLHEIATAARQARPADVAVTFMNYVCPETWGSREPMVFAERAFLSNVASACNAPVTLFNRGPLPEHVIECSVGGDGEDLTAAASQLKQVEQAGY